MHLKTVLFFKVQTLVWLATKLLNCCTFIFLVVPLRTVYLLRYLFIFVITSPLFNSAPPLHQETNKKTNTNTHARTHTHTRVCARARTHSCAVHLASSIHSWFGVSLNQYSWPRHDFYSDTTQLWSCSQVKPIGNHLHPNCSTVPIGLMFSLCTPLKPFDDVAITIKGNGKYFAMSVPLFCLCLHSFSNFSDFLSLPYSSASSSFF